MDHNDIIMAVYGHFVSLLVGDRIPVSLRPPALVGTVQDDPFDSWVGSEIRTALPELEIAHSGSLTTPDILLRDPASGTIVGLEVK